jgi:outer membrane protein assembly factor BamA
VGAPAATSVLLHPRKRFYAGGARSVRGFAENQLGPRILTIDPARLLAPTDTTTGTPCTAENIASGECDPNVATSDAFQPRPLGGNSLTEASVEYRLPLTQNITAALFVDGARLDDRHLDPMSTARSAITPGFGVRYRSPIGPVRIDMGIRPRLAEDLPVITQIADESGALQLVRLSTLKRYDPLEKSGGFLGGVFRRLQLHLSIGEAF